MPTPPRESNSRIAYTRWEPVADETDENRNNETTPNVIIVFLAKYFAITRVWQKFPSDESLYISGDGLSHFKDVSNRTYKHFKKSVK
jgi:hypothetical protein